MGSDTAQTGAALYGQVWRLDGRRAEAVGYSKAMSNRRKIRTNGSKHGPSAASIERRRERRRQIFDSRLTRVGFVLTFISVVLAVVFYRFPWPAGSSSASASYPLWRPGSLIKENSANTAVYVVDGPRYSNISLQRVRLACGQPSFSSARLDAYTCLETYDQAIYDPCFAVTADSVLCFSKPNSYERFPIYGPIVANADPVSSLPNINTVWPWAIALSDGVECHWRYAEESGIIPAVQPPAPAQYACGPGNQALFSFTGDTRRLSNGRLEPDLSLIIMQNPTGGIATDLTRSSNGKWTVMYSPKPGTAYSPATLGAVWY